MASFAKTVVKSTFSMEEKLNAIRSSAYSLKERGEEYRMLLDPLKNCDVVLLGESSHGTHEFYRERAQISKLLIRECGFSAIAVEADWPDAYHINSYITNIDNEEEAIDYLSNFTRFPQWMWNNADMLDLVGWLRNYNELAAGSNKNPVRFYGLDLYSLYGSAKKVIAYLEDVDSAAAERARARYSCLSRFGEDGQQYGMATRLGLSKPCTEAVVKQLLDLLNQGERYRIVADAKAGEERFFDAEQNSRLVVAAENYYRTMLSDDVSSWNLRDEHMADTLSRIRDHFKRMQLPPKVIVWAHNSHIGDARHTDMSWRREELNVGQLAKQTYNDKAFSIGFTTYNGTVTAASKWDGQPFRKKVRNGLSGSYEDLFHRAENPRFLLDFRNNQNLNEVLRQPMLERAIGVLYLPETERRSHYFEASISGQFDAVIHLDHTRAVEPTTHEEAWKHVGQTPETYPTGI